MANENDIITHFSMQGSPPLFLCLLWKMLLETDHINQIGFRFEDIIILLENNLQSICLLSEQLFSSFIPFIFEHLSKPLGFMLINRKFELNETDGS